MRPAFALLTVLPLLWACTTECHFPVQDTGDAGAPEPRLDLTSAGTLQPTCAPDDGSALLARVGLVDAACGPRPEAAFLELIWWEGVEEADGLRVDLDPDRFEGQGNYFSEGGEKVRVVSGWILVQEASAERGGRGQYEVRLESGVTIADTFDLMPCYEDLPECG